MNCAKSKTGNKILNKLFYKVLWVILLYFLFLSQYKLWFSDEGVFSYLNLKRQIETQKSVNTTKTDINNSLYAEVKNLKHGSSAIEERARNDLGLIKNGEKFYHIVE